MLIPEEILNLMFNRVKNENKENEKPYLDAFLSHVGLQSKQFFRTFQGHGGWVARFYPRTCQAYQHQP